jgi:hypothetical protein
MQNNTIHYFTMKEPKINLVGNLQQTPSVGLGFKIHHAHILVIAGMNADALVHLPLNPHVTK